MFLSTPPSSSTTSALFVGWGLLVGYDLFLNRDNASEPLDIACDDASLADGWCRLGSLSGPISFNRSQGEIDAEGDGARSPTNYATAYIDLDWLYGRDEESAAALRTLDEGNLNLTADGLPHLLPDGTWLVSGAQSRAEAQGTRSYSARVNSDTKYRPSRRGAREKLIVDLRVQAGRHAKEWEVQVDQYCVDSYNMAFFSLTVLSLD